MQRGCSFTFHQRTHLVQKLYKTSWLCLRCQDLRGINSSCPYPTVPGSFLELPVKNHVTFCKLFTRGLRFLTECQTVSTLQTPLLSKLCLLQATSFLLLQSHHPYMPSEKKFCLILHAPPFAGDSLPIPWETSGWPAEGIQEMGAMLFINSALFSLSLTHSLARSPTHLTTSSILSCWPIILSLIIVLVNVLIFHFLKKVNGSQMALVLGSP